MSNWDFPFFRPAIMQGRANLSALPDEAIEALRKVLSGVVLVEPDKTFEIERSLSHGGVAAVHAMASGLGAKKLLGPDFRERDLLYGLILSRVLRPISALSTLGWWSDTTLGTDLRVGQASTDGVHATMGWLGGRQKTSDGLPARSFRDYSNTSTISTEKRSTSLASTSRNHQPHPNPATCLRIDRRSHPPDPRRHIATNTD